MSLLRSSRRWPGAWRFHVADRRSCVSNEDPSVESCPQWAFDHQWTIARRPRVRRRLQLGDRQRGRELRPRPVRHLLDAQILSSPCRPLVKLRSRRWPIDPEPGDFVVATDTDNTSPRHPLPSARARRSTRRHRSAPASSSSTSARCGRCTPTRRDRHRTRPSSSSASGTSPTRTFDPRRQPQLVICADPAVWTAAADMQVALRRTRRRAPPPATLAVPTSLVDGGATCVILIGSRMAGPCSRLRSTTSRAARRA